MQTKPTPLLNQTCRPGREPARQQPPVLNLHDRVVLGVFDVEVRRRMIIVEDANDDAEEYRNDRHKLLPMLRPDLYQLARTCTKHPPGPRRTHAVALGRSTFAR